METAEPDDPTSEPGDDDPGTSDVEDVGPQDELPDDGGDVAGRDPDEIAREIEQTRAELADTIDAIAARMSPKRAASRGAQAVKAQVSSARARVGGDGAAAAGSDDDSGAGAGSWGDDPSLAAIAPKVAMAGLVLLILVFLLRRRSR